MKITDEGIDLGSGCCLVESLGCAIIISIPILALAALVWALR